MNIFSSIYFFVFFDLILFFKLLEERTKTKNNKQDGIKNEEIGI
jgi:hypothetical protein